MSLTKTITLFEDLMTEADKKSEIKIYTLFIFILKDLISKELSEKQYQAIENELDRLELKSAQGNKKRYFRKKLNVFKRYLQTDFSFVTEGYYMAIGMNFGYEFWYSIWYCIKRDIWCLYGTWLRHANRYCNWQPNGC